MPTYILVGVALSNLLIGLFVFWKNPRSIINFSFLLFVAGAALWIGSLAMMFRTHNFFFNQFIFHGGTLMFAGLFIFSNTFPAGPKPSKLFWLFCAPFILMIIGAALNLFVKDAAIGVSGSIQPVNGPLMPAYAGVVSLYVISSVVLLVRSFRKSHGTQRAQIQYMFLGMAIFMISTIVFDAILPTLGFFRANIGGPIVSIVFVGLTAYAIVRHQLMDIRVVIRRGLIYASLIFLTTLFYLGANFAVGNLFAQSPYLTVVMVFSLTAVFAILSVTITEKLFRLEERVRERTAELQKLRNEEKQMMTDISHGLQTPLTILKSELETLKNQASYGNLRILDKSVDDISKFIYDFLNLAKLEMAPADFTKKPVDLSRLLNDLIEYFSVLAEEKGIAVFTAIEADISVLGEKSRLEELITNLLSNAVKYMPQNGEKKINIALKKMGATIELSVSDTGIGINPADQSHIFERFYRIKNEGLGIGGTGLGLAICKRIAERHGGTISVSSEPGKGSVFLVRL